LRSGTARRTIIGMNLTDELCERYVALWNEPDTERRRALIADLWAADGEQVLVPPQETRAAAAEMNMRALFEARGHRELMDRATDAYERFIASGEYAFRRRDDPERLRDVVKFRWEMVSNADGKVAGVGLEFLVLDAAGKIVSDYQFIEA
jgi:hypothetical protein